MRIKSLLVLAALAIAFLFMVQPCPAQKRGASTPEERAQAVRITRALEAFPLDGKARDARRWLLLWLTDVPDISVTICADFLAPLLGKDKNYGSEIFGQMMYGQAAFIIENPDKAKDDEAIYTAGLESSLKTYESILKEKPKAKWQLLDDLIEKRGKGELDDYVRDILGKGKCKGKN